MSGSVSATSLMTAPTSKTLTIKDNETAVPQVRLSVTSMSISEGATDDATTTDVNEGLITVTATLDKPHTSAVTVTVSTDPDGTDDPFTVTGTTITIAADATTSTDVVTIDPDADDTDADDEPIVISATVADGDTNDNNDPMAPSSVTVTITDDDEAPSAPTAFTAVYTGDANGDGTADDPGVTLTWTASASLGQLNGTAATAVTYEYRLKPTGVRDWDNTAAGATAWAAVGGPSGATVTPTLTAGVNYDFQVRATIASGPSSAGTDAASVVEVPSS